MATNVRSTATHKVYHQRARTWWLIAGGSALLVAIWQLANEKPVIAAFFLLGGILLVLAAFTTRLVISPTGIAYDNQGLYRIVTTWSNVERIANIPGSTGGTIRALVLREPAARGWTFLDVALLPEYRGRTIPLSVPSRNQRRLWSRINELERDIQHYAPHVVIES